MISIENLTKNFGLHAAVQSVTFSAGAGEALGLLGPNGAGKTTIMRMITGYLPPTEGRVLIDGMDMFDHPDQVKRKIGYLPEQPPLYTDMTVDEYLEFAGRIRGVGNGEIHTRIREVAGLCGIADKLGRLIGNLSKGFRQRVGLAQALVHDPDILILDEPTVGLDPKQIIEIRELIKELGKKRTVILSSHILQEVTSLCKKVAIINQGRLLVFDSIDNLSAGLYRGERVLAVVASPEKISENDILSIAGVESLAKISDSLLEIRTQSGRDLRAEISARLVRMDVGLLEIRTESLSLEDIFLQVITGEDGVQDNGGGAA